MCVVVVCIIMYMYAVEFNPGGCIVSMHSCHLVIIRFVGDILSPCRTRSVYATAVRRHQASSRASPASSTAGGRPAFLRARRGPQEWHAAVPAIASPDFTRLEASKRAHPRAPLHHLWPSKV